MSVYSAKNANNFPTFRLIPNYVRYMLHDLFQVFFYIPLLLGHAYI